MSEPVEDLYFKWLCAKVIDIHANIYTDLLRILHKTEFEWVLPEDSNRAEDGLELRMFFVNETRTRIGSEMDHLGCSVFEMLIALAQRAEFHTDIPARDWFWMIIGNLRLDDFRRVSGDDEAIIKDILDRLVYRTYDYGGQGGMFPIRWPKRDQTGVEIWYQFHEFIDEQRLA